MKRIAISAAISVVSVVSVISFFQVSASAMDPAHQQQVILNWLGQPVLTPRIAAQSQNSIVQPTAAPNSRSVVVKRAPGLAAGYLTRTEPPVLDLSQTQESGLLLSSRSPSSNPQVFASRHLLQVPSTIDQLVGGKLQLFKRIDVPRNTEELYMVRGEIADNVDLKTNGPYLRIKLNPDCANRNLIFGVQSEWKIRSVNRGIMLVDDPRIEFIELRKNTLEVSSFVWDLSIALDNAVQIKCQDGSIIEKQPLGGLALRF